jgi:hypothetical protein
MNVLYHERGLGFLVVQASSLRRFTFTVCPRLLSSRAPLCPSFFLFLGLRAMRLLVGNALGSYDLRPGHRRAGLFPASGPGVFLDYAGQILAGLPESTAWDGGGQARRLQVPRPKRELHYDGFDSFIIAKGLADDASRQSS